LSFLGEMIGPVGVEVAVAPAVRIDGDLLKRALAERG
jgi:hypothetical protein